MHCEDVRKQLKAFSSGRVPVDIRQRMQTHLAGCAACRMALGRMDAVAGVLAGVQAPPVPDGFVGRVMLAARNRRQAEPTVGWNPFRWWRLTSAPMHLAAAAVLVIGLTAGLMLGWIGGLSATETVSARQGDPLDTYQLDYLGETPDGSLAGSYLALVAAKERER